MEVRRHGNSIGQNRETHGPLMHFIRYHGTAAGNVPKISGKKFESNSRIHIRDEATSSFDKL